MRQALNENKKVQAAVIVGLLVAGVLLFMKMSSQSGGAAGAPAPTTGASAAPATGTGAGAVPSTDPAAAATGAAAPTGAAPAATPTAVPAVPASSGTVSPQALIPGPGLPADVARAYAQGNAIVLLIVKDGATDDELVRDSVSQISRSGVAVFVAAAKDVARYSRIAQGAGVSRVPALVVVRPRRTGGDVPQATVSYGFRSTASVVQAVDDALYSGKDDVPYHPG
jgi:hypothetical protein